MIIKEQYPHPVPGLPWRIKTSVDAQILHFGTQGPTPTIWLDEPDMDNRILERTFAVAWTGQDAPTDGHQEWWQPIGSATADTGLVWHCFELIEPFS